MSNVNVEILQGLRARICEAIDRAIFESMVFDINQKNQFSFGDPAGLQNKAPGEAAIESTRG
jgi:hypothetical protein